MSLYRLAFTCLAIVVSGHTYRHVKNDQVLQRQRATNSAWVELDDGQRHEYKVGGPYTIGEAQGVMVGDIWLLAGQSNMRGFGFFDTTHDPCHVFRSNESWGKLAWDEPMHQLATSPRAVHHHLWDPTAHDPSLAFSRGASLGPAFAERYHKILGVPVGLVPCAHGGVAIQEWMKNNMTLDAASTTLYGAMMDKLRLVGGHVMGVVWYQGESDANSETLARLYQGQFTRWLEQLAVDLQGQDHWLIVYAQIGRTVKVEQEDEMDMAWNMVRNAQLDVYRSSQLPIAIVSTMDCDMDDYIHLSAKGLDKVGYRMADAAVRWVKHQRQPPGLFPTLVTMVHQSYNQRKNWRHWIRLDYAQHHHTPTWLSRDTPISGFTIRNTKNRAVDMIHSVRISKDEQIDLHLTEEGYQQLLKEEHMLWYGYGRNTPCNLITSDHVASLAFGPIPIISTPLLD